MLLTSFHVPVGYQYDFFGMMSIQICSFFNWINLNFNINILLISKLFMYKPAWFLTVLFFFKKIVLLHWKKVKYTI